MKDIDEFMCLCVKDLKAIYQKKETDLQAVLRLVHPTSQFDGFSFQLQMSPW